MVDPLLNLDHRGKAIFRMSVNPQPIISRIELGTSSLMQRIDAVNRMCDAGYPCGHYHGGLERGIPDAA